MAPLPWAACLSILFLQTIGQSAGVDARLEPREAIDLTPSASGKTSTLPSYSTSKHAMLSSGTITAASVEVQSDGTFSASPTSTLGPGATFQSSASPIISSGIQLTKLSSTSISSSLATQPNITAKSLSSAVSCASVLTDWGSSSFWWSQFQEGKTHVLTTQSFSAAVYTVPSYSAAQTTTLCDGHARVVGSTRARRGNQTITHYASTTTFLNTRILPYPSPRPTCDIDLEDCIALVSLNSALVIPGYGTPICTTTYSYVPPSGYAPEPSAIGQGDTSTCDKCTIVVSAARLIYWPVQTRSGSGNICNNTFTFNPSDIITGTPTGRGPNTFVTKGIIITSPSVALSLTGISRLDRCYTEISESIIPVHPRELTSIRGPFSLPFNFADLNYHCQGPNGSVYEAAGPGASCYPAVPASAYFGASSVWNNWYSALPATIASTLTIADDYRPDLVIPSQLYRWASSLWNPTCIVSSCGVWDPPTACAPMASIAEATVPSQATTTADATPTSVAASPAEPQVEPQASKTNVADSTDSSTSMSPVYSPPSISSTSVTDRSSPAMGSSSSPQDSPGSTALKPTTDSQAGRTTSSMEAAQSTISGQPTNAPPSTPPVSSTTYSQAGSPASSTEVIQSPISGQPTDATSSALTVNSAGSQTTESSPHPPATQSSDRSSSNDLTTNGNIVVSETTSDCNIACYIISAFGGRSTATQEPSASGSGSFDSEDPAGSTGRTSPQGTLSSHASRNPYDPSSTTAGAGTQAGLSTQTARSGANGPVDSQATGQSTLVPASQGSSGIQVGEASSTNHAYFSYSSGAMTGDPISDPPGEPSSDSTRSPSQDGSAAGASLIGFGSQSFTERLSVVSVMILENEHTTVTLPTGGNVVMVGSQQVAVDPSGHLVVGQMTGPSTVTGTPISINTVESSISMTETLSSANSDDPNGKAAPSAASGTSTSLPTSLAASPAPTSLSKSRASSGASKNLMYIFSIAAPLACVIHFVAL